MSHPKHLATPKIDILISTIFLIICTFISSLLCAWLSQQICVEMGITKKRMDIISKMIICCCIVSTICNFSDLFRHLICYILNVDMYIYPLNNIMGYADLLYYIGTILFYLIALGRIQLSFVHTKYSINNYILIFLYTLIASVFILSIYYVIIVFITPSNTTTANDFW
eukprot:516463_1